MKILLCTSETGTHAGGLALHCSQLKEIFEYLGHEVFVEVLLNPDGYYAIDGGYDSDLGRKIRSSYMLKSMIGKYGKSTDICVSCGGGRTAYYSMLFCKERDIPLYIVLCGSEINLSCEKAELAFYNTEALEYATAVIGLSEELNHNAERMNKNKTCRYYVIPNYYDLEENDFEQKEISERISFVSGASYLGEKKGIANLLMAFSKLIQEKGRNDLLYLYGKIDDDIRTQYEQIIRENALEQNVRLCGRLDRDSYHKRIRMADTYIQASPFEGLGNSVAEALALGKDILISDTGYIAETIKDEYPDHIIGSLYPEDMADVMLRYCENVYPRKDAPSIRQKLNTILSRENVIDMWRKVFGYTPKTRIDIGFDSCIAVMFHDVECDYTGVDYAPEGFERLIDKIYERGFRLCSAREFFRDPQPERLIICTFDDGYESVYRNALPIMGKYDFTATVYMCPDLIGRDNFWNHKDGVRRRHLTHDMIAEIKGKGWEIGSHGMSHVNMLRLSEHEIDECLAKSKELLSRYGPIESFCYPYGQYNSYIKGKISQYYSNAFSVDIGGNNYINDLYQITRLTPEQLIKRLEL